MDHNEIRLKRLQMRANRRGMKEMDVVLGGFALRNLNDLTAQQLDLFEAILDAPDQDILNWVLNRAAPPADWADFVAQIARDAQAHARD